MALTLYTSASYTTGSPMGDDTTLAARTAQIEALAAAGLRVEVNTSCGLFDITASLKSPAGRTIEVLIDEDGYVQVSYWNRPRASPSGIADVITRVVAALTTAPPGNSPRGCPSGAHVAAPGALP